jgi:hypothetical protein
MTKLCQYLRETFAKTTFPLATKRILKVVPSSLYLLSVSIGELRAKYTDHRPQLSQPLTLSHKHVVRFVPYLLYTIKQYLVSLQDFISLTVSSS